MPFNEQPPLDGDAVVFVPQGVSRADAEVGYFAFDLGSGTVSNPNEPSSTTTTGDTVSPAGTGTAQANITTEGIGASFFGDGAEGTL